MALILCPDCGKKISDRAYSCPECGCPINDADTTYGNDFPYNDPNTHEENNSSYNSSNTYADVDLPYDSSNSPNSQQTSSGSNKSTAGGLDESDIWQGPSNGKPVKKKNSVLSIIALILCFVLPFTFVGLILAIYDLAKGSKEERHVGSVAAIILFAFYAVVGIASISGSKKQTTSTYNTSQTTSDSSQAAETTTQLPKEAYVPVDVGKLMDELDTNALKASSKYKDQYIEITGRLGNIDASGDYINILDKNDEYAFIGVQCYVSNDTQAAQIAHMTTGDIVTLRGKCIDVGEVLGYSLQIDSIDDYESTPLEKEDYSDEYLQVSAKELITAVKENAMKAKQTYEGKNMTIKGTLDNIDAQGAYICVADGPNDYSFVNIQCYLQNEEQRNKIMDMSIGDELTITGKCTNVGEIIGYVIDIGDIQ